MQDSKGRRTDCFDEPTGPASLRDVDRLSSLPRQDSYSHSIVPGGLLVMSKQRRLTPLTSLMIRLDTFSSSS